MLDVVADALKLRIAIDVFEFHFSSRLQRSEQIVHRQSAALTPSAEHASLPCPADSTVAGATAGILSHLGAIQPGQCFFQPLRLGAGGALQTSHIISGHVSRAGGEYAENADAAHLPLHGAHRSSAVIPPGSTSAAGSTRGG